MSRLSAIAVIAAAGFAGCGGGGGGQGGQASQPATAPAKTTAAQHHLGAAQTVTMSATEFKFNPSKVNVKAGEVTFKVSDTGGAPHALEIEGTGGGETDTIQPGGNAELKVNLKPGTYKFYCPVGDHEQRGMVGELTVK